MKTPYISGSAKSGDVTTNCFTSTQECNVFIVMTYTHTHKQTKNILFSFSKFVPDGKMFDKVDGLPDIAETPRRDFPTVLRLLSGEVF